MSKAQTVVTEIVSAEQQGKNYFFSFPYNRQLLTRFHAVFENTQFIKAQKQWLVGGGKDGATSETVAAFVTAENARASEGLKAATDDPIDRPFLHLVKGNYILTGYSTVASEIAKMLGGRFTGKVDGGPYWEIPGVFHEDLKLCLPVLEMCGLEGRS